MTQTTAAVSFRDCEVSISTNGSAWTDISGYANEITPDGGERETDEMYTFDGDTAIITKGKRAPIELKCKFVYTEGVSDPQEVVRAAYEGATDLYLRWSPKGGDTGEFMYTTPAGTVKTAPYPGGEAGSAETTMTEFTLLVPYITKSVVA